jgi:hypothetical protein
MNDSTKTRKPRRLTRDEIIKTKERYREMWEANRPRMLRLAELGRKAVIQRHEQDRLWMKEWLSNQPGYFSRSQLRDIIEQAKSRSSQPVLIKTESYIKTMIRYGYIKFEDDSMLWRNNFSNR